MPRPLLEEAFVPEAAPSLVPVEDPLHRASLSVHTPFPGPRHPLQFLQRTDAALADRLTHQPTDGVLGGVQPTPVNWREMKRKTPPQSGPLDLPEGLDQGGLGVGVEVVGDEVNRASLGVLSRQQAKHLGEGRALAVGGGPDGVATRLGLEDHEHVDAALANVFVVPLGDGVARRHRFARSRILAQHHGLLVEAHHRLKRIPGLFQHPEHLFHPDDVADGEFGHAPHFFPATASARGVGGLGERLHAAGEGPGDGDASPGR